MSKKTLLIPLLALVLLVPASGANAQSSSCAQLSYNLYFGRTDAQTGGEVSRLQAMLGGQVTGYFGPLTEQLVEAFQAKQGLVSSGSPDTTGYGAVGPRTRALLATSCSGVSTVPVPVSPTVTSPLCSFTSNSTGKSDTISWGTKAASTSACRDLCTVVRNEKYGTSESGTCTYMNSGGVATVSDIAADGVSESELVAEFIGANVDIATGQSYVQYEIILELTAADSDVYLSVSKVTEDTSLSSVSANTGWNFDVIGTTVPTGAAMLASTANIVDSKGLTYVVREGETEEFTMTVVSTTTSNGGQLKLGAIQFGTSVNDVYSKTLYLDTNEFDTPRLPGTPTKNPGATIDDSSLKAGTNGPTTITGRADDVSKLYVYQVASTYKGGLDYASIVEANKGDGAPGQTAIIAYPNPSEVRNGKWSAYFGGWPTVGTYTVLVFDAESKVRLATGKLVVTNPDTIGSVTFPKKTYDVTQPTFTGTAKNLESFTLVLTGIQDKYADVVFVKNGKWSHKVSFEMVNGTYGLEAYDPKGNLLGLGVFRVLVEGDVVETTVAKGVTAVGVYEGSYTASNPRVFQGNVEGYVNVNVTGDAGGDNQDLVLTSYEPVNWILNVQSGVKIKKIIVAGYNKSRVTNVPAGTEVEYHSYATDGTYYYAYQASGDSYTKMKKWLTGLYPASDGDLYGKFVLPGYSASSIDVYLGWKG